MVVYNKTSISKDDAITMLNKSTKIEYMKKFVFPLLMLSAGLPIMIYGLVTKDAIYISFGGVFIAFAIVLTVYNFIQFLKIPKVVIEKNKEVCEYGVLYDYRIKEHSIFFIATTNNKNIKGEYGYNSLKKIYEYPTKYELKFSDNVTLYVNKEGFQDKKMEEFFRKNIQTSKRKIKTRK